MSKEENPIEQGGIRYERTEFSLHTNRFEINVEKKAQLPVTVLKEPEILPDGREERGVLICGDSVVDDLVKYMPDIKKRWFIITTTQSHAIPKSPNANLHLFSNYFGNDEYLASEAKDVPFLNTGDGGDFVNPDIFYPDKRLPKKIDSIYCSKWADTKRVEIFVKAAELLPHRKFVLIAIPMSSERKRAKSLEYRQAILKYIEDHQITNIEVIEPGESSHMNSDGSLVPGGLFKDDMRLIFQSSRSIALASDINEAINRSVTEALCCDTPVVMTRDCVGGSPKLVNDETGILVDPSGQSMADGIEYVIAHADQYHPRENFLQTRGIYNANRDVQQAVIEISAKQGDPINALKMRHYGGDLWSFDFYLRVASEEIKADFLMSQLKQYNKAL